MTTESLTKLVLDHIPKESEITRVNYEWPRVAIYTTNPSFLQKNNFYVSEIVKTTDRRVIVRTERESTASENEDESREAKRFVCCCGEESWST